MMYTKTTSLRINVIILTLCAWHCTYAHVQLHTHQRDATHTALTLEFDLDEYDGIYEQYLHISIDNPYAKLSDLHYSSEPVSKYVASFKESKSLFMGPSTITGLVEETDTIDDDAYLYVTYQLYSEKHPRTVAFPLHHKEALPLATAIDTQGETYQNQNPPLSFDKAQERRGTNFPTSLSFVEGLGKFKAKPNNFQIISEAEGSEKKIEDSQPGPSINPLFLSLLCAILGLFLLARASYSAQCTWRSTLSIIGMALLATSIVVGTKAYQDRYHFLHVHIGNPTK